MNGGPAPTDEVAPLLLHGHDGPAPANVMGMKLSNSIWNVRFAAHVKCYGRDAHVAVRRVRGHLAKPLRFPPNVQREEPFADYGDEDIGPGKRPAHVGD